MKTTVLIRFALGACLTVAVGLVGAQSLRWAVAADALSLDPHAQNEVMSNSLNGHLYEKLTARDAQLGLIPGLARRWQQIDALSWRFYLQPGVRFHDGSPLSAEDVVFSVQRAQHPASAVAQYARRLGQPSVIAPGVIGFKLDKPNPVMLDHVDAIAIMNLGWARANGVLVPLSHKDNQESFAKHNANGTGRYRVVERQADVKTVLQRFPGYWGQTNGQVERLVVLPMGNALTRTAALITGDVDLVTQPAPQDLERLAQTPGLALRRGPENRILFLGFDQQRDELLYSNVKGRNPLKDARVRRAFAHALDMAKLQKVVMRDMTQVTGCMLPSALTCARLPELDARRPGFDSERALQLLAQAGYPKGFELTLDCPNDRYVNDEALCVAMAAMLARVNITLRVNAMPRSQFFPKLDRLDTSFYLLGWGGAELDPQPTMDPLMHSFDPKTGSGDVNYGRFADAQLDAWIDAAGSEASPRLREPLIKAALLRHQEQVYHLVLHRQTLAWAMKDSVKALPAANNHLRAWLVELAPAAKTLVRR